MTKMKQRRWLLTMLVSVVAMAAFGFYAASESDTFFRIKRSIDVFANVYKEIAINYVDEVDPDRFMRAGIDGMLKSLDPYTVYIGEKEGDELDLVTTGKYGGVGVTIGMRDGAITVINLLEGFSASKQGIEVGDRILEIDGKALKGLSLEDVRLLVRGSPGTELKMKIERDGDKKPLEFVLMREEIPVRNVTYSGYVSDGIGYIRLERFSRTAGDDVRNAIKELKEPGKLNGIVLDLRDNPGGLLEMAVEVSSKFLPESSLVVSTRGRKPESEHKYYSNETPMAADVPLVVLVDRGSASASEIVAGAIQDLDRGVILGTRTFGKGLVQTITRISDNASLKITTARYYTPSGRCIQEIDYTHRDKDGIFTIKPDSLRREFKTAHDRNVFEAGGIAPDTIVQDDEPIHFIEELNRKALFFKFANQYALTHKTLPGDFEVDDSLLEQFEAYSKEKKFTYEEESEIRLKELREIAQKSRYNKAFFDETKKLESIIKDEKERQIHRYQDEVKSWLKMEIEGRINGEHARIESTFEDDQQLQSAIGLLKNRKAYSKLLSATSPR